MGRTNRFYQEKLIMDRARADERVERANVDHEKKLSHTEITNRSRFDKLSAQAEREEKSMRNFFEQSSLAQRENFEMSLRDLRERNKRDQDLIVANFSRQAREREEKFREKLGEITSKHAIQVQDLQQDSERRERELLTSHQKEKKELVAQKNLEIQRQATQYENRIAKMEEAHKQQVDIMQRRHEESLANMTRSKAGSKS